MPRIRAGERLFKNRTMADHALSVRRVGCWRARGRRQHLHRALTRSSTTISVRAAARLEVLKDRGRRGPLSAGGVGACTGPAAVCRRGRESANQWRRWQRPGGISACPRRGTLLQVSRGIHSLWGGPTAIVVGRPGLARRGFR